MKAISLSSEVGLHRVTFEDGEVIVANAVIMATGGTLQPPGGRQSR
jgi:cation diffusion facilitator CzcD-associated flavoprotein CzcO